MAANLRKLARTVKMGGPQVRAFQFDRASVNTESRTIEVSFSSETRDVVRWFGVEELGHNAEECRLGRINSAGPFLMDHNTRDQVGVVEKAWLDPATKTGRAQVRFGKSVRAEEIFQDVQDGIRQNVSFAYDVFRYILVEEGKGGAPDILRAIDWEPLEISLVSIPADVSVGVGRSAHSYDEPREIEIYEAVTNQNERDKGGNQTVKRCGCGKEMVDGVCPDNTCRVHVTGNGGGQVDAGKERSGERKRIQEIQAVAAPFRGKMAGADEMEQQFINDGRSVEEFSHALLDKMRAAGGSGVGVVNLDLGEKEQRTYSIMRAINMAAGVIDSDGFEMEVHREIAKKLGRETKGMFIPMQLRAPLLTATSGAGGGYAVATELRDMIELLRAKMLVRKMGATVLSGLTSNVAFPRQTGTTTLYWGAEDPGADVTESNATLDQVTLGPKTAQATTQYSRQLLQQSSFDMEMFVRGDLSAIGAIGLDNAAINGLGTSNQPRGILATSGIGSVAGGTNGLAPTWAHMVALEAAIATANADVGSLGYLSTPKARGILKTTPKFASTATPIWEDGKDNEFGMMNGYRAGATTQVPSNLVKGASGAVCSAIIFGNWADLIIGEFGVMEIIADPYSKKKQGLIEVTSIMLADLAVRHPASFAAMADALTTGF